MDAKKRRTIRIIIMIVAAIALAVGIAVYILAPDEVEADEVSRGDVTSTIREIGTVICDDPVTIYAPVSGRIRSVCFNVNDSVRSGDVVAEYDMESFEYSLLSASLNVDYHEDGYNALVSENDKNKAAAGSASSNAASLKQQFIDVESGINQIDTDQAERNQYVQATMQGIEAAVANMNTELEIMSKDENVSREALESMKDKISKSRDAMATLPVNGMTSEESAHYNELKMQLELIEKEWTESLSRKAAAEEKIVSEDQIEQLSDSLELAKLEQEKAQTMHDLADSGVISAGAGTVIEKMIDDGAVVEAGAPVMVVQPLTGFKATVSISRFDIDTVSIGQQAVIKLGDNAYEGIVDNIVPVAVYDSSGKPKVRVDVVFADKSVTPTIGIEAEVTIYTGEAKDVLTVSDKSVYTDDEGDYVFAIVNGKVEKRYITRGLSGDGRIEVTSGLSEGEKTIVSAVSEDDLGSRVTEE
ncbi:HlyD family secretion protein [Lachnospiraceae bacterium XBB2008]|nr:HlyD family secretion protein [Lachnospiraceae bacterium XBB2008]